MPLKFEDLKKATRDEAAKGCIVTVHYIGTLQNGRKFDSSRDRKEPFSFRLGAGDAIKGWEQGIVGMRVGGRRKLEIPPELGYGSSGAGNVVPPNATLFFDIELLSVKKK